MNENANPYESQGNPASAAGGYQQRNNSGGGYRPQGNGGGYQQKPSYGGGGGYNKGNGGGGYRPNNGGGGKPAFQKKEYTAEELKNVKVPLACVVTGNENFPDQVALAIGRIVKVLESKQVVVRTGGLNGVDQVVMDHTREAELHIPFRNFNKLEAASQYTSEPCLEIARRYMPELDTLPNVPKATFSKNPRLVLGRWLSAPAQLVIVWSEDGCEHPQEVTSRSGIAGHVVKIAAAAGIRVINLQRQDAETRAMKFAENIYVEDSKQPIQHPPGVVPSISAGNQPTPNSQPGPTPGATHGTPQQYAAIGNPGNGNFHQAGHPETVQYSGSQGNPGTHQNGASAGSYQQFAGNGAAAAPSYDY